MRRHLVEAASRGDHEAFEVLATSAGDRLYALARLILRSADVAEDAVQEALVRAWQQLHSLRDPDRFDAWLYRTAGSASARRGADIYFARLNPAHGWGTPAHLGCEVNSAAGEASPSYVEEAGQGVLYFSSNRTGVSKIYRSVKVVDGSFAAPGAVAELNTASEDARPNVRKDGLEIVFDSTRPGGSGGPDIYAATRGSVNDPWSAPVNLGTAINSAAPDTRASLSWDGQTLLFGSGRAGGEGSTDIYVSTR